MFKGNKANLAAVWLGFMLALSGGAARSVTYQYPSPAYCGSIAIEPSGKIDCTPSSTQGCASKTCAKFYITGQLSCNAGLSITADGDVSCAGILPQDCKLEAGTPVNSANGDLTFALLASCANNPLPESTEYSWTGNGVPSTPSKSNTQTVILPASTPASPYPYSVIASNAAGAGSTQGATVNVANPGYKGPFAYIARQDSTGGKLTVVDTTKTGAPIVATTEVGDHPVGVAVNPAGTRVYVTNLGSGTLSVINTADNQIVPVNDPSIIDPSFKNKAIATDSSPSDPYGIAVSPSGTTVYVANSKSNSVAVIDAASIEDVTKVATTKKVLTTPDRPFNKPYGIAVNPTGSKIYVTNYGGHSVSVINSADDNVLYLVAENNHPFNKPYGIAVNPKGNQVYVANEGDGSVSVIDTKDDTVYRKVPVGNSPRGVAVSPDGTKVYVVNSGDSDTSGDKTASSGRTVSAIDVADVNLDPYPVATLEGLGELSNFISFSPAGTLAYVTNAGVSKLGDLSILDVAAKNLAPSTVPVGSGLQSFGNFVGPAIPVTSHYPTPPYQGLWYNQNEKGWGLSVTQHGSMIFVAVYTYDQDKQPIWYVMSSCPVIGTGCTGELYKMTGGARPTEPWDALNFSNALSKVGMGTLKFVDANNGQFDYTIDDKTSSKTITRQVFRAAVNPPATDYTDLWWNPGERGWGVALTHQDGIIFATWYTYDAGGMPVWYTASACAVVGSSCKGELHKSTGGMPLTETWNTSSKNDVVGEVTITFSDAYNGVMSYSIGGVNGARKITRQPF